MAEKKKRDALENKLAGKTKPSTEANDALQIRGRSRVRISQQSKGSASPPKKKGN